MKSQLVWILNIRIKELKILSIKILNDAKDSGCRGGGVVHHTPSGGVANLQSSPIYNFNHSVAGYAISINDLRSRITYHALPHKLHHCGLGIG